MAVDQLPGRVREFANYLNGLLARLDQGGGWCAVFWQRDPDGMQACLEGREVPPWDVVESLLQDLATEYGTEATAPEARQAHALHTEALAAHDSRPGGRDALGDRLDIMLREQRYAAERQAELGRLLASATTREAADAIRLDLAWAHDDHERATARCAELRQRIERLDQRSAEGQAQAIRRGRAGGVFRIEAEYGAGGAWQETGHAPGPEYGTGGTRPESGRTPGMPQQRDARAAAEQAGWGAAGNRGDDHGRAGAGAGSERPGHGPGGDSHDARQRDTQDTAGDAFQDWRRRGASAGEPQGSAAGGGPGWAGASHDHNAADFGPAVAVGTGVDSAGFGPAGAVGADAGPAETTPSESAAASQPAPPAEPAPKQRKRRRGSARFAGMDEEEAAPVVVPPTAVPTLPTPAAATRRSPRGARFAGAAEEAVGAADAQAGALDAGAGREVVETVETLLRLRADGRSGEAHALLVEAAYWPAARFPLLAAELQRAGLGHDWATLLWEAASLPADRLVAAADALVGAGRGTDGEQILRQGVARPAEEIGGAVLGLVAEGRRREVAALLDAYVRVRTPEEAARSAAPGPQTLVPLLLEAARGVSEERHWDLVHALRVAGFTA
ncbi:hypothetical protein [Streptomyces sp. NPDC046909]|uniref:hypothetical protein n=1 Tax=Streptomyces sp. NPDC046909 TaxID=3155617 RepID=UPI0033DCFE54